MAVTEFQAGILKRLAGNRIAGGETYIAGGLALNYQLRGARYSADIDVFNNSIDALHSAAEMDMSALAAAGYSVSLKRERDFIVEAAVSLKGETTDIQWVRDSAQAADQRLHPFDLATNKLLALAGRTVPRDWVDAISCSESIQPLGLLAWAASGKDPGLSPRFIIETAARTHYAQSEIDIAVRTDVRLDVAALSKKWHEMIESARTMISFLPAGEAGKAVICKDGKLFNGTEEQLAKAIETGDVAFHEGRICGAWPQIAND